MKILFCNLFLSLTSDTIEAYFKRMGHICISKTYYTPKDLYEDRRLDEMIKKDVRIHRPDMVFSINFWPPVARVCHREHIKYISYGYDSPQNIPKTDCMEYETNFIFLFDREETISYQKQGIDRVYHMPLATDVKRWDSMAPTKDSYDITLIGRIYESTFPMLMSAMDEYLKGYFKAVISAQQQIYGYYMADELIDDERLALANECFRKKDKDSNVSKRQLSYSIGSYITHLDRIMLLRLLQNAGEMHLFTQGLAESHKALLKGVVIHGGVSYETEMPSVFKSTKVNLNPVLRVIKSGIPQRALDVMGCNAFLLSSYQPELAEYFNSDEEVAMYTSYEEAVDKAKFFLEHEDIRKAIAANGYEKVKKYFTYEVKLKEMFIIAGLEQ